MLIEENNGKIDGKAKSVSDTGVVNGPVIHAFFDLSQVHIKGIQCQIIDDISPSVETDTLSKQMLCYHQSV